MECYERAAVIRQIEVHGHEVRFVHRTCSVVLERAERFVWSQWRSTPTPGCASKMTSNAMT